MIHHLRRSKALSALIKSLVNSLHQFNATASFLKHMTSVSSDDLLISFRDVFDHDKKELVREACGFAGSFGDLEGECSYFPVPASGDDATDSEKEFDDEEDCSNSESDHRGKARRRATSARMSLWRVMRRYNCKVHGPDCADVVRHGPHGLPQMTAQRIREPRAGPKTCGANRCRSCTRLPRHNGSQLGVTATTKTAA